MWFTITRARGTGRASVYFATVDGTALHHADYVAKHGIVTFRPGQTVATISVAVKADKVVEPSEIFAVVLSKPHTGWIGRGTGTGTIIDR
jgi:hypothetical protein